MRNTLYLAITITVFTSCSKLEKPTDINLNNVIKLSFENHDSILTADNADKTTLVAYLDSSNVGVNQNVVFVTEQGHFAGSSNPKQITVRADGHKARAILISDTKVNSAVQVSGQVGAYITYSSLSFITSYPDDIFAVPSGFNINTTLNSKIYVDVNLRKDEGEVSDATKVQFDILKVKGNPKLFVSSLIWSKSNTVNRAELSSMTTDTGSVKVIAKVLNSNNQFIYSKDTILVKITN